MGDMPAVALEVVGARNEYTLIIEAQAARTEQRAHGCLGRLRGREDLAALDLACEAPRGPVDRRRASMRRSRGPATRLRRAACAWRRNARRAPSGTWSGGGRGSRPRRARR